MKKIANLVAFFKFILVFKLKILKQKNIIFTGKTKISGFSFISFCSNSIIKIEGNIELNKSKIFLKNSKINTGSLKVNNTFVSSNESEINLKSDNIFQNSKLIISDSFFEIGKNNRFYDVFISIKNSSFSIRDYNKFYKGDVPPTAFVEVLCNSKLNIGVNNTIAAELKLKNGKLKIDDNVFINSGTRLRCLNEITIGSNSLISYECIVFDNNSHSTNWKDRELEIVKGFPNTMMQTSELSPKTSPIIIADNCWIGLRSTILKGSKINSRAIVGTNSVVTSEIPPDAIVVGNPCKIVKINNL